MSSSHSTPSVTNHNVRLFKNESKHVQVNLDNEINSLVIRHTFYKFFSTKPVIYSFFLTKFAWQTFNNSMAGRCGSLGANLLIVCHAIFASYKRCG